MQSDYTVQDGIRVLKFNGDKLGHGTSDDGKAQRWTEVDIYKSTTGRYVVAKVGKSAVYHRTGQACAEHSRLVRADRLLDDDAIEDLEGLVPCKKCNPPDVYDLDNGRLRTVTYAMEQPRPTAHVTETAEGVIECLKRRDTDGTVYLPKVAKSALEEAIKVDAPLHEAYAVQHV